jgi:DNA-binding SARP family transcriptional activator/tetratricopeptide (TPR) repeat protein
MEFGVLGPLEVTEQGRLLALGGRKPRALLAMLLLQHGRVLSVDELIDGLWGDEPPGGAEHGLQVYVSELRKLLADGDGVSITRRGAGYVLEIPTDSLDLERFERLRKRGRAALVADDPDGASVLLRQALAMWRGTPLADFTFDDFAGPEIERLEAVRLETIEDLNDADLAVGIPLGISELRALVEAHPFRERMRAALMLALYRDGRQAEALEESRRARALLAEELGVDPGPRLTELETAILTQDPTLVPFAPTPDVRPRATDAAPTAPSRRIVTVLVAVLVPERTDGVRLDPEATSSIVEHASGTVLRALEHHGATASRHGREFEGVFGHPDAHEDDAMRAVRAAWEITEALASTDTPDPDSGVAVLAQVGVHTAEVLTSGGDDAMVDMIQPARAIAALADRGTAVLDVDTHALVRAAVRAEPIHEGAAVILRSVDMRPGALGVARRMDSPMVGRGSELAELTQAFDRVAGEHACRLVTVSGEAGVGKSRLVDEFARRVAGSSQVLVGRCLSYGDAITYWPIAEVVRVAAEIQEFDDAPTARRKLHDRLPETEDRERIIDALSQIIGVADAPLTEGESSWSVRRFFEGMAAEGPVVLIVEDIHWAEPTLLDLLETTADWLRDSPLLVVATARPEIFEQRPGWGGGRPDAAVLAVRPLSREATDVLIENLVRHPGLDADAKERITLAAEGNPLFVEQLLSMWIDEGFLRQEGDAWSLAADVMEAPLPTSLQTLLTGRLDRLPAQERAILGVASVIGRSFDAAAIDELTEAERAGDNAPILGELVRKDLIRPERWPEGGGFRFRHVLIMQAAYAMLPKARRAELHLCVADLLDARAGDRMAVLDEIIGDHLARAARYRAELGPIDDELGRLRTRAGERLAAAAARALARADMPAAATLFGSAVSLLEADDPKRLGVLPELGNALIEVGRLEDAERIFEEAIDRGDANGQLRVVADAVLFRFESQLWGARMEEAAASVERAQELIARGEAAHDDLVQQRGWSVLGMWAETCEGQTECTARAMRFAERSGDRKGLNENMQMMSTLLNNGPTPVEEGLRIADGYRRRTAEDPVMQAAVIVNAEAGLLAMAGRMDEAREAYGWARSTFRELALPLWLHASGTIGPSWAELRAGDPRRAQEMLVEGIEGVERIGARGTWLVRDLELLVQALVLLRDLPGAEAGIARLEQLTDRPGDPGYWLPSLRGQVAMLHGDASAAVEHFRHGLEVVDVGLLPSRGDLYRSLAEALHENGQDGEAIVAGRGALEIYRAKGDVVSSGHVEVFLGNL